MDSCNDAESEKVTAFPMIIGTCSPQRSANLGQGLGWSMDNGVRFDSNSGAQAQATESYRHVTSFAQSRLHWCTFGQNLCTKPTSPKLFVGFISIRIQRANQQLLIQPSTMQAKSLYDAGVLTLCAHSHARANCEFLPYMAGTGDTD